MKLTIIPWQVDGEIRYHVVDTAPSRAERSIVLFSGSSWSEAEQYIADLGGG